MNATDAGEKFPRWQLLAVLAFALLLRVPSLDLPLDRDEGEYATLAFNWLQGWGLPYRDFLEQKPPLAILAYLAAFFAGGPSVTALRVFALLWQLASCAALFSIVWSLSRKPWAAALAGALFAALSVSGLTQGLTANSELFVSLPMMAAVAVLLHGRSREHWLLSGACIGLAGLAKQAALPAALVIPLAMRGDWRLRLRALGLSLGGAASVWLLCLLAFGLAGAAGSFLNCVVFYNLGYAGQGMKGFFGNLAGALFSLGREEWPLWMALIFAAVSARKAKALQTRIFWAWLGAMFLGTWMSGRFYPHYFQTLAAPLSALVALWAFAPGQRWHRAAILAAFAVCFARLNAPLWAAADGGARSIRQFGLKNFATAPACADVLRARTPEGSRILVWGSEAELYFLSQRRPATRFLFNYPFTGEAPAWPGGEDEILRAMEEPSTSALLLSAGLDRSDPFQRKIAAALQKYYSLHVDLAPEMLIGLRKN